ncbi:hypothetical protein GCM10012275_64160 [Longimycelium tulufanense]|uniref:Secreted protein n=1 Tax=Longimycelium tulufanense TaxID=907463 RepID=A0A8J3FZH2_9PSEU|nr:hypothetical protein [Longimycelium tulufanense]GGM84630.1 hypothetical protein GCM10012275_64160 [Longimycelium tulufanense]
MKKSIRVCVASVLPAGLFALASAAPAAADDGVNNILPNASGKPVQQVNLPFSQGTALPIAPQLNPFLNTPIGANVPNNVGLNPVLAVNRTPQGQ